MLEMHTPNKRINAQAFLLEGRCPIIDQSAVPNLEMAGAQ